MNQNSNDKQAEELAKVAGILIGFVLFVFTAPVVILSGAFSYIVWASYYEREERKLIRSFIIGLLGFLITKSVYQSFYDLLPALLSGFATQTKIKNIMATSIVKNAELGYFPLTACGIYLIQTKFNKGIEFYSNLRGLVVKSFYPFRMVLYFCGTIVGIAAGLVGVKIDDDRSLISIVFSFIVLSMASQLVIALPLAFTHGTPFYLVAGGAASTYVTLFWYYFFSNKFRLDDKPQGVRFTNSKDGVHIGRLIKPRRRDLKLSWEKINHHVHILGQPGSGKSVLLRNIYAHQVRAGTGLLMIDLKADMSVREDFKNLAAGTGSSKIQFQTAGGGTTGVADVAPTTKMTIDGNGYVGIGTVPSTFFHVKGSNNAEMKFDITTGPKLILADDSNVYSDIVFNTVSADQVYLRGSSYGLAIGGTNPRLNIGYPDANYSTAALTVNGNVGFGTTAPAAPLEVKAGTIGLVQFTNSISAKGGFLAVGDAGCGGAGNVYLGRVVASGSGMCGGAMAGDFYIDSSGTSHANGGVVATSDLRKKRDIQSLESSLEKITSLNGYTYYWIDKNQSQKPQLGVIAQEVEKIFPEAVEQDHRGFLGVNYMSLVAPIIEAIKELNSNVKILFESKAEKSEIEKLKEENAELKQYLCAKDAAAPFCK